MKYFNAISELLEKIKSAEKNNIQIISKKLVETINNGGILYFFGAGHSSIITEEAFHRAGGLIPVHPILYDFLSPHISSKIAGKMERLEGVASILFNRSGIQSKDMMWIASNSGINAAAIEMAVECKKNNIATVALTSMAHSQNIQSRHSTGKRLFECVDYILNNHCPAGDALVDFDGVKVAAGSTIANSFLYHWVLTEACEIWRTSGKELPIYLSANLPGGDAHNEKLELKYKPRIPLL